MAVLKPLIAVGSLGAVVSGTYYGFSNLRPKTLKQYLEWQGLPFIKKGDKKTWDAILFESKEDIKKLADGKDISTWDQLEKYCENIMDEKDYESQKEGASLFCVENVRTIEGKLMQKGIRDSLIKDPDDYKVGVVVRQNNKDFWELIKFKWDKKLPLEEASEALSRWCKDSLKSKYTDTLLSNVESFCKPKPYRAVGDLIEHEKLNLINDDAGFTQRFEQLKDYDSFKGEMGKYGGNTKEVFEKWCKDNTQQKLYDDGIYPDLYSRLRFRCVKENLTSVDS